SAADDWLGNTGRNTTYSVMSAERDTTSCESGPAGGSEGSADPELGVFGSQWRKLKENKKLTHKLKCQHQKQRIALFAFSHSTNC
ncbi:hypothetical protein CP996_23800, partial [Escherichia coli]|uniref:hypothetical protein n=2 Tax=Escherichia coli TaxID=562 RepID=UPI000BC576D0